jgi:hypothetical protein
MASPFVTSALDGGVVSSCPGRSGRYGEDTNLTLAGNRASSSCYIPTIFCESKIGTFDKYLPMGVSFSLIPPFLPLNS